MWQDMTFTWFKKSESNSLGYTRKRIKKILERNSDVTYYVIGYEVCPSTKREHLQGYLELYAPHNTQWRVNHLPGLQLERRMGTQEEAIEYCKKIETKNPLAETPWIERGYRTEEPKRVLGQRKKGARSDLSAALSIIEGASNRRELFFNKDLISIAMKYPKWVDRMYEYTRAPMPEPIVLLYDWQKDVLDKLSKPPVKRQIIWIWSEESETGKSTFGDYLKSQFRVLCGSHELKRTLYQYDSENIIYFDLARSDPCDAEMLRQLEELSNHTVLSSTMYQGGQKWINSHIVVSTNRKPPCHKLPNRITEYHIGPNGILRESYIGSKEHLDMEFERDCLKDNLGREPTEEELRRKLNDINIKKRLRDSERARLGLPPLN